MTVSPRACVLCGFRRRGSREDVMPRWLRKEIIKLNAEQGLVANNLPSLLFRICEGCNQRLNQRFENPSSRVLRPLLRGEPCVLQPREQADVGAWVVKTALLLLLYKSNALSHGAHEEELKTRVRDVMQEGGPTTPSVVLLSKLRRSEPADSTEDGNLVPSWYTSALALPSGGFCLVSTHGHLVTQAIVGGPGWQGVPSWVQAATASGQASVAWPPSAQPLKWPPRNDLTEAQLDWIKQWYLDNEMTASGFAHQDKVQWVSGSD